MEKWPLTRRNSAKFLNNFSRLKPELLLLYFPIYALLFFLVEQYVPTSGYWVTNLPVDDKIPFIKEFIIFYFLWYPYLIISGIFLFKKDTVLFKKYLWMLIVELTVSLMIFLIFPSVQNLRPKYLTNSDFYSVVSNWLYSVDTNTNVFPSMHVVATLSAVICLLKTKKLGKLLKGVAIVLAILICFSTVFIKQHAILDVIAAILIGALFYALFFHKNNYSEEKYE